MPETSAEEKQKLDGLLQADAADAPAAIPLGQLDGLVNVLDAVRRSGPCSRGEVASRTGLSRAVVSQRIIELMKRGLVEEGEFGVSSGGRMPRLLRFRANAGHLLVAALGATSSSVALTDLSGTVLDYEREPIEIADGPEIVLNRVRQVFRELQSRRGAVESPWGIGVGIPGPVEFSTGRPVAPPIMPGWDQFGIREHFAEFDAPVWVDNDANLLALGEATAGVGRGHDTMLFIKIGTGIGAGLIINGRLHRGAQGCAGDVGHIQVVDDANIICRCGNVGCLEAIAGGGAIARLAAEGTEAGKSSLLKELHAERGALTTAEVGWAASHGDHFSVEMIGNVGHIIGHALASLVNVLNPSVIVIGGGVSLVGDLLLASIREAIYGRSLPLATRSLLIQRTSLGDRGGVIGAAALVADQLFARRVLSVWTTSGHPIGNPGLASIDA